MNINDWLDGLGLLGWAELFMHRILRLRAGWAFLGFELNLRTKIKLSIIKVFVKCKIAVLLSLNLKVFVLSELLRFKS